MQSNPDLLNDAWQQLRAGRIELASERCLAGLADSPHDSELHYVLALCDLQAGKHDDALKRFERVARQDSTHAGARFELGRLHASRGEGEAACRWFDQCLTIMPDHAPARTLRARLDLQSGHAAAAIEGLRTALRADQDHVPAMITLSNVLLQQGDRDQAVRYASRAVELQSDNALAQLNMARVFIARGELAFAEQCLANAAEKNPDNPLVYLTQAELYQRSERFEQAVVALDKARRLGVQDPQVLRQLAANLVRLWRRTKAAELLESLLSSTPDREALINLAEMYAELGDARALERLIVRTREHSSASARWVRALSFEAAGAHEEALALAKELLTTADDDLALRARLLAARLGLAVGQRDQVADVLAPLVGSPKLEHGIHWTIGRMLDRSGHPDMAIRTLEEVAAREGLDEDTRAKTRTMLIELHDHAGQYQRAAALFDSAAWRRPYLGEPAYYRGRAGNSETEDVSTIREFAWPAVEPERAGAFPVFLTGWPFSGRDLAIAALSVSVKFHILPPDDWSRRRGHVQLPLDARNFGPMDDERYHLMRRHFLRGSSRSKRALEPTSVQSLDLAQLARVFPGTVVINPVADAQYLELQSRLAGYAGIPDMLASWQRDQDVLAQIRSVLPLRIIDCPLDGVLTDPGPVLRELSDALDISYEDSMRRALEQAAAAGGYRPPEHWKNYQPA